MKSGGRTRRLTLQGGIVCALAAAMLPGCAGNKDRSKIVGPDPRLNALWASRYAGGYPGAAGSGYGNQYGYNDRGPNQGARADQVRGVYARGPVSWPGAVENPLANSGLLLSNRCVPASGGQGPFAVVDGRWVRTQGTCETKPHEFAKEGEGRGDPEGDSHRNDTEDRTHGKVKANFEPTDSWKKVCGKEEGLLEKLDNPVDQDQIPDACEDYLYAKGYRYAKKDRTNGYEVTYRTLDTEKLKALVEDKAEALASSAADEKQRNDIKKIQKAISNSMKKSGWLRTTLVGQTSPLNGALASLLVIDRRTNPNGTSLDTFKDIMGASDAPAGMFDPSNPQVGETGRFILSGDKSEGAVFYDPTERGNDVFTLQDLNGVAANFHALSTDKPVLLAAEANIYTPVRSQISAASILGNGQLISDRSAGILIVFLNGQIIAHTLDFGLVRGSALQKDLETIEKERTGTVSAMREHRLVVFHILPDVSPEQQQRYASDVVAFKFDGDSKWGMLPSIIALPVGDEGKLTTVAGGTGANAVSIFDEPTPFAEAGEDSSTSTQRNDLRSH